MPPQARLLARLFGVALLAHVVGNWHQPDLPTPVGAIGLLVGLLGIALAMFPSQPLFLAAAGSTVVSIALEIPQTGNHWLLAGLAGLVVLVTRGSAMTSGLRWLLVVFYGFAAFAKLNTGFFDPSASCAVFYANQSLGSWGLTTLPSASAGLVIWTTVLIEVAIVPLLVWRKTRWFGILAGSVFHGLIALDLDQHFYDFTAVLFFLFAAFLPQVELEQGGEKQRKVLLRWGGASVALVLVVLSVLPPTNISVDVLSTVPFLLWVPFLIGWIRFTARRFVSARLDWRLTPAALVIVGLAFVNGLTPYTELKTAYGFNMYSNLLTAQGQTNHLLVPATLPLRDGYDGPVEIIASSDPGLELYRERGYLIAYPQFQRYLVGRSIAVIFARDGVITTVEDTASGGLASTGPWWWRFMPLRALDRESPPRCQDVFLPAL